MILERKYVFFTVILLFFLTSTFVSQVPGILMLNKLLGVSFILLWVFFSRQLILPLFFNRYLLFILYSVIFSFVVAAFWEGVYTHVKTMVQLCFMLLLVYNISISLKLNRNLKFISFFLIVYFFVSYFGNSVGFLITEEEEGRMTGLTANANALGFRILYGCIGTIYLASSISNRVSLFISKYWYLLFIVFAFLLLPTGSRKSFIALTTLFFFYAFVNSKNIIKTVSYLFIIFLPITIFFGDLFYDKFRNSIMGERFIDERSFSGGVDIRGRLYQESLDLFYENPIFGIGLNNFRYHSESGHETHSYYMEILTGTGIVGFILLFSIYFVMGRKAITLYRLNYKRNEAIFILSFLFLTAIMGIGFSYHHSFPHWFIIAFIFAFLDEQYNYVNGSVQK